MNQSKILGTLYGAAYGDSLGAITESCTRNEILNAFPKECTNYTASISRITKGIIPGQVTDDFGASCYIMKTILKHKGIFNRDIATEAILDWSTDENVFKKYAGQNTKKAVELLKVGVVIDEDEKQRHFSRQNTNGGAMKVSPLGLLALENTKRAIEYAIDLCWPTHYNSAAASAASAIACAVCESQKKSATLDSIFEKAVYGAKEARLLLETEGYVSFGPYVDEKIQIAVEIGQKATDYSSIINQLVSVIGTGITVQESVPAVFAIIAACKGEFKDAIKCAVNAGGDTDTIASMTGAVLGGYNGIECIDNEDIQRIQRCNEFLMLEKIIEDYAKLILEKGE